MSTYTIPEINIEKLERRIKTLRKKCEKYNYAFTYEKVQEVYKDFISPEGYKVTEKCYLVKLSGKVLHEGYTLAAKVDKTDKGNMIYRFTNEYQIPERYYTGELVCDHCKTTRNRKHCYLLRNENGDWIQVGTECVSEFTSGGLNVSDIAYFAQTFDFGKDAEKIHEDVIKGRQLEASVQLREALAFSYREINNYGYTRSSEEDSTKEHVINMLSSIMTSEPTEDELKMADDCAAHFANIEDDGNEYLHNLKVIANTDYPAFKLIGFIAAMMQSYLTFMSKETEKEHDEINNEYLGELGDKLTLNIKSWKCVYQGHTIFGDNYLYRFITDDNHIITWGTSTQLADRDICILKGTVKEHNDFRGQKQTKLTRCKVTYARIVK